MYELMLFWDKKDTFSMLWSVMDNMNISHNLQNDRGRWSSDSERWYFDKVEFTKKVIWTPQDLDFK